MGTDAVANLVIGFPITDSDLWTEEIEENFTCSRDHKVEPPTAKHCPMCGERLTRCIRKPTEGYAKLCYAREWDPESFASSAYSYGEKLGIFTVVLSWWGLPTRCQNAIEGLRVFVALTADTHRTQIQLVQ